LSVADNAGDAVFLYVSASSERQECGNKTGIIRKKKKTTELKIQGYIYIILYCSFIS
jgi:hypothetical protein